MLYRVLPSQGLCGCFSPCSFWHLLVGQHALRVRPAGDWWRVCRCSACSVAMCRELPLSVLCEPHRPRPLAEDKAVSVSSPILAVFLQSFILAPHLVPSLRCGASKAGAAYTD